MNQVSVLLIIAASGVYLTPTIRVHNKLKKYDDKTPGLFMMHLKMNTYLKKYNRLSIIQHGKKSRLSKLWYFYLFCSISLIALSFVI